LIGLLSNDLTARNNHHWQIWIGHPPSRSRPLENKKDNHGGERGLRWRSSHCSARGICCICDADDHWRCTFATDSPVSLRPWPPTSQVFRSLDVVRKRLVGQGIECLSRVWAPINAPPFGSKDSQNGRPQWRWCHGPIVFSFPRAHSINLLSFNYRHCDRTEDGSGRVHCTLR